MSWWWCCPEEYGCELAYDSFGLDTIASGDWTEEAGDWSIDTVKGELTTQDANARLEFDMDHPDEVASHWLSVHINFTAYGDKARVWLADTLFVEVEFSTSTENGNCVALRLIDDTGTLAETSGSLETYWGVTVPSPYLHILQVCYHYGDAAADNNFTAQLIPSGSYGTAYKFLTISSQSATASGIRVGLATGDVVTGTVTFKFFWWWKHKSEADSTCASLNTCYWWEIHYTTQKCTVTQVSGSWTAPPASQYWTTYDANALLLLKTVHPYYDDPWNQFTSGCCSPWTGDTIRIYVGYKDASNYGALEIKASTCIVSYVYRYSRLIPVFSWLSDGYIKLYDGASEILSQTGLKIGGKVYIQGMSPPGGLEYNRYRLTILDESGTKTLKFHLRTWLPENAYDTPNEYGRHRAHLGSATMASAIGTQSGIGTGSPVAGGTRPIDFRPGYGLVGLKDGNRCTEELGFTRNSLFIPSAFTVTIAGVSNSQCFDCAAINVSHIVPIDGSGFNSSYYKVLTVCGSDWNGWLRVDISRWAATDVYVQIYVKKPYGPNPTDYIGSYMYFFGQTADAPRDIAALDLSLVPASTNWGQVCGPLNAAGITCAITAN